MKKLLLTFFVSAGISLATKAQEYVPFPTGNISWNVFLRHTCLETPPDTFILRYAIHGDTVISGKTYNHLCLEHGDTLNPSVERIGFIWEEDKKVYYVGKTILNGVNYVCLLYDFTKQKGDTIRHNSGPMNYSVVLDIDSVLIDGKYRKRYYVNNNWFYHRYDYIIEGIGSVKNSLLGHISDIPTCGVHYWEHICFKENGVVKYLNPNFDECFPPKLLAGDPPVYDGQKVRIYPNPVKDRLTVENNTGQNLSLKMVDGQGRLIFHRLIHDAREIIQITMNPGIFLVIIADEQGRVVLKEKCLKQ